MPRRLLVIGYGNPGRLDDGLGPAFAERVEQLQLPGVTVESNYQLQIEDAAAVAAHDVVLFADASVADPAPFVCRPLAAQAAASFTSHSVAPEHILHLANTLFGARTTAYVLGIRGYEFNEFGEKLGAAAAANLAAALRFFRGAAERDWEFCRPGAGPAAECASEGDH
jgi:hydrogenase maturation protease